MDVLTHDHKPELGHDFEGSEHRKLLFDWLKHHKCLTIGRTAISLINDQKNSALFAGLLGFIGLTDTKAALTWWSDGSYECYRLNQLSIQLFQNFPRFLTLPGAAQKVKSLFRGLVESDYFGVHFSTRTPPKLSDLHSQAIHTLRVWILIKGFEYANSGVRFDENLETVCMHLRHACDNDGPVEKLIWFATFPDLQTSKLAYEVRLRDYLASESIAGGVAPSWQTQSIKALLAILDNQKRPKQATDFQQKVWLGYLDSVTDEEDDQLTSQIFETDHYVWIVQNGEEIALAKTTTLENENENPTETENKDGSTREKNTKKANASAPQVFNESRTIAFLSAEDNQFLRHSWNRPNLHEWQHLKQLILHQTEFGGSLQKAASCLAVLAMATRRSLDTVRSIQIGRESNDDWQLDRDTLTLHRLPSRRSSRWTCDEDSQGWVRSISTKWTIELTDGIKKVLAHLVAHNPSATSIGACWSYKESAELAFNDLCRNTEGLQRVTSGSITRLVEQFHFENTNDATYSTLMTNPRGAGITGSGAYPSWTANQISAVYPTELDDLWNFDPGRPENNCLGSELDPDEEALINAFAHAKMQIEGISVANADFFQHHNLVTTYLCAALLAATGARPVDAMFESIRDINFERGYIYLNDKVSPYAGDNNSGRIVPLPRSLVSYLKDEYVPHLLHVANTLHQQLPELADEIHRQMSSREPYRVPFLILFRTQPDFDWCPISSALMDGTELFRWPMPWNLFRHRLSTRLRKIGCDPELIDAQLGHSTSYAETYGPFSVRCFNEDLEPWRQHVEACYDDLRIELPKITKLNLSKIELASDYKPVRQTMIFGTKARAKKRKQDHAAARQAAMREIEAFVAAKLPSMMEQSDWDEVGRRMIYRGDNIPHQYALIRYDAFETYLKNQWRLGGSLPKISKWLVAQPATRSGFTSASVHSERDLLDFRKQWDEYVQSLSTSKANLTECVLVGAVDLCLYSLMCRKELIQAVLAANSSQISICTLDHRAYIEFRQQSDAESQAVIRSVLPTRTVAFLGKALAAKKKPKFKGFVLPECLAKRGKSKNGESEIELAVEWVRTAVVHESALRLPGVVAAYLSGEITHYSLPRGDWLRVKTGSAYIDPQKEASAVPESSLVIAEEIKTTSAGRSRVARNNESNIPEANELLQQVRSILAQYGDAKVAPTASADGLKAVDAKVGKSQLRRDVTEKIRRQLRAKTSTISSSIHALVAWIIYLLEAEHHSRRLKGSTVLRYFGALKDGFLSFGHSLNIVDLDTDEMTEFYKAVASMALEDQDDPDSKMVPSNKKGQTYVLERLKDFHGYAEKHFGLDMPDWSEVSDGLSSVCASPGYISDAEYQLALRALCSNASESTNQALKDAFLLLLSYRFGLRPGEAASMARQQWIECCEAIVLAVTGTFKPLKTRGSQRQVPLVSPITQHERSIAQRWLGHWQAETGNMHTIPLFFDDPRTGGNGETLASRRRIIAALKQATQSDKTTLHHARHSFANNMAMLLLSDGACNAWPVMANITSSQMASAKLLLLSTKNVTRRTLWSICRLLGHAAPTTTLGSYLHFVSDWADQFAIKSHANQFGRVRRAMQANVENLNEWRVNTEYLKTFEIGKKADVQRLTARAMVKYLRLRSQGVRPKVAEQMCSIDAAKALHVESSLSVLDKTLRSRAGYKHEADGHSLLLAHISSARWNAMIELAERIDANTSSLHAVRNEAIKLIGPSRQLHLWEEVHFELIQQFLRRLGMRESDIVIYRRKRLDPVVVMWATQYNLPQMVMNELDGKKVIQLDVMVELEKGKAARPLTNSVAVMLSGENTVLRDSFELSLMWLVFCVFTPAAETIEHSAALPDV